MNYYFIVGKEDMIDHIRCVKERNILFWKKGNKKMNVGDIIYIFISGKGFNRVMFRMEISETSCYRDDDKYWKVPFETDSNCFKFTNTSASYNGEGLTWNNLTEYGIKRGVQYKKLNHQQSQWLDSYFI